jgi:hypothetical protein
MRFTKLDYCQYLLSSQINYTITNLADHLKEISYDQINRYLRSEKLTPRLLCENAKPLIKVSQNRYVIFDDTVLDKRYSEDIELARRQYSGNEHGVLRGIGLVNCVYVNPKTGQLWVIDYRIYDSDGDGKSKLDHGQEMLQVLVYQNLLPFGTVCMDSWYATKKLMQYIDKLGKYYYCPLKKNRLVDDSGGGEYYKNIESLTWTKTELDFGKIIKIKFLPKDKKVKLFWVTVSTEKTEYVVTNDLNQDSTDAVQQLCDIRLKIEE